MHCQNYLCKLQTCYCGCDNCELMNKGYVAKAEPCQRCGYCDKCGRGGEYIAPQPYIPYLPSWFCYICRSYHPYGWTCLRYQPAMLWIYTIPIPNTTITYPSTCISNTSGTIIYQLNGLNNEIIGNS